jgi:hypothetical protein
VSTLKIHILSDLHLESTPMELPATDADVVVLAGDIDKGDRGAHWAINFPQQDVIYVAGNHEYYSHDITVLDAHFRQSEVDTGKVHALQNSEWFYRVEGLPRVRFLGATLWSDFALFGEENADEAAWNARQYLRDFQKIFYNDCVFLPRDARALFLESVAWLSAKLDEPFDGPTVVVTHHAPSILSVDKYRLRSPTMLSAAFASHLDHLVPKADLWIHGHTHGSSDYCLLNGGRVISNPRGYRDENERGFNPKLIVEIAV